MKLSSDSHLDAIRHELLALAGRQSCRINESSAECPCRWRPNTVKHPETGLPFTTRMAWEFIVEHLEAEHPIEEIELLRPLGKKGYVLLIDVDEDQRLYIKLQLRSGKIIGRSFHYSHEGETRDE